MDFNSYIFTKEKHLCSGCAACVQVCKQAALTMKEDEEGFLYPELNEDKCIRCGACIRICPEVNNIGENIIQAPRCYVSTTSEEKYYKESASIGLCTMLAEEIINEGGIVFGVYLDETVWKAYHKSVTDWRGIESIRNSKYLQSDTRKTYSEVKNYLKKGEKVLYVGTPCQIAGLKAFLKNDYSNLYTVDIVCHGVFSPKLMPLAISYWEKKFHGKLVNFRFRSKRVYKLINGGMVNFDIIRSNGHSKHIERHASSSPTYRAYAYSGDGINHNLRPSCYSCSFRAKSRYGDITIGDPWGIGDEIIKNKKLTSYNSIRSLFTTNTIKGATLIQQISKHLIFQELPLKESFVQPALLPTKRTNEGKRVEIYSRIRDEEYSKVIEDVLNCDLVRSHKLFVRNYWKAVIKRCIRTIIQR